MGAGDSSGPATMPGSYVEAVKPLSEARAADWENYLASKAANPKPAKEEPNPNSVYFEDMVLQGLIEPKPPEPSAEELRAVIDKYEAKPPSEVFGTDDPAEQLMAAVMGFREDLVIKLCAAKAPTNFVDELVGYTPLHIAAHHGHEVMVAHLLDAGADAATKDNEGNIPLVLARKAKHVEAAKLLESATPADLVPAE